MIWALLILSLGGFVFGMIYKNRLAAQNSLSDKVNGQELRDLDQLIEESVLVREDLERLLLEATKVSSKILNELSGQIKLVRQFAHDEKAGPLSWSESLDLGNDVFENMAKAKQDRIIRSQIEPGQNCLKAIEVNRGQVAVMPVQWAPLENPQTEQGQPNLNQESAGAKRMDPNLTRLGDLKGTKQNTTEERKAGRSNSVLLLCPSTQKQTSRSSRYDQICQMAEEGFSVLRIAETIGTGLGEVQLVLDIYRKTKIQAG